MKTFIYTVKAHRRDKYKGSTKHTAAIYRMKRNVPHLIGTHSWESAACRGERSEIIYFLRTLHHWPGSPQDYSEPKSHTHQLLRLN